MTDSPIVIIDNNDHLLQSFHTLTTRTIINCRLRLIPGEEHLLVDLLERGVPLIPSATAQLCSRSKVHQARIFSEFMLPNTVVAYDVNSLLGSISTFNANDIRDVVIKRDRKNGGIGIHRFASIEDVYNLAELGSLAYPFVIQPLIRSFKDIRLLVLGDYTEAYERNNPNNFRKNLHCGGSSKPVEISDDLLGFCQNVLQRGVFPYAHIDIMEMPDGRHYLTEINLRGGLKGAKINSGRYQQLIDDIHKRMITSLTAKITL
ncbi:ATP-grasp domain-containing protein [Desulfosediminicola flagellatus]|uniref:ATP-grasp domain-containing protein n=1 Tax=Desulfosediminicola flagellatus TaxID=2569541 RepID=UPI0010ABFC1D|nr:hypothetical protein [Desulfosediminicola flagellatus]